MYNVIIILTLTKKRSQNVHVHIVITQFADAIQTRYEGQTSFEVEQSDDE
jgi:hypothetical protein